MKIWQGYGSEHSYSMVLVGHFADIEKARKAESQMIKLAGAAVDLASSAREPTWHEPEPRPDEAFWKFLRELGLYDVSLDEVQQFGYDHSLSRSECRIEILTDEGDVQGMVKAMIASGARVEIYSRHDWEKSLADELTEELSQLRAIQSVESDESENSDPTSED